VVRGRWARGERRLAGDVADGVDRRVAGPAALVDGNEAARVDARPRALEPQPGAGRPPADRDQQAVERLGLVAVETRLDRRALLEERGHLRPRANLRDALLA